MTLFRGDTRVKKSDGDEQKGRSCFQEKIIAVTPQNWQTVMTKKVVIFSGKIGLTPSVAAPSDTGPSDATAALWTWLWGRYYVPQNGFLVLNFC